MKESIMTYTGQILGYIETLGNGDQVATNYIGKILGYYRKSQNVTTDYIGKILYRGNALSGLIIISK